MPAEKIGEKVPSWIERILLPSLNEIKGEIKAVNTRIDSLDERMNTRIDSLRNEMNSKFEGMDYKFEKVDERIDSLRNEMLSKFEGMDYRFDAINTRLDSIDKRIPVIEEITALKIRMAELEKRLAAA